MKIYTKTGDLGETGLFGNIRVPKDHLRIDAYGTLDEANALLGIFLTQSSLSTELKTQTLKIQNELFQLGAELATPSGKKLSIEGISNKSIDRLENEIDTMELKLTPLKNFILPGGSKPAAIMHLARTVVRRAERAVITLSHSEELRPEVIQYLNRLSDHLFVSARFANFQANALETEWKV